MSSQIDPSTVLLLSDDVSDAWKVCVLDGVYYGEIEYNGSLGARISAVFVIFFVSTFFTLFPLAVQRIPALKVPWYVYAFARYFGTGVIVATAFIHLMDPAYGEIGGNTCVGMTGNWAIYSWCPAIILASAIFIFLVDVVSGVYVERKYNVMHSHEDNVEDLIVRKDVQDPTPVQFESGKLENLLIDKYNINESSHSVSNSEISADFEAQFGAFLILEFGIIFHSVMIGLNLGSTGDEFKILYIVLVFHQTFEGLGIGARLSAIPFPDDKPKWIPWACCIAYGLVTPISTAIGLGVRYTYMSNSYNANIVLGVLDAISAGILIYTGLVELLARDFIFSHERSKDLTKLTLKIVFTLIGAGIMSLLGKWA